MAAVGGAASAQHDCVEYEPTVAGDTVNSTWEAAFEIDEYEIAIPSDPGGGYVVATLSTTAPSEPGMLIHSPDEVALVTQPAPTTNGPSPQELQVAFEVAASTTFRVELTEAVVGTHPVAYTWSWEFFSKVDCYEPNDGRPDSWPDPAPTARQVPLDQVLEAFSLAGHLSYVILGFDPHVYDWYQFEIGAPTPIWVAIFDSPHDQIMSTRIFDDNGFALLNGPTPFFGFPAVIGPKMLPAGTYYVEVLPVQRGAGQVTLSEGDTLPDHFLSPYKFIIGTGAVDCHLFSSFCDGFESGDTSLWSQAVP